MNIGAVLVHTIQPGDKSNMFLNPLQRLESWRPFDRLKTGLVEIRLFPFAAEKPSWYEDALGNSETFKKKWPRILKKLVATYRAACRAACRAEKESGGS